MYRAVWHDTVLAESDRTLEVEGNQYFPPEDVNMALLTSTDHHSTCPWKGLASYYDIKVRDMTNSNAAWYYPEPKAAAKEIRDYIAFWHGVVVEKV